MKIALRNSMLVSTRVKGPHGVVRELNSILDINSEYCAISWKDTRDLGYPEAGYKAGHWQKTHPNRAPFVIDFRGIERSILFTLKEVALGPLVQTDVDTVLIEMGFPQQTTFDLILGRSFLRNFAFSVEVAKGYISIEQPTESDQ